jgi:hypothetical protein
MARMRSETRHRWGQALWVIVAIVFAITPVLEPMCDTLSGNGHHQGHVHTVPALTAQGPTVPGVPSIGAAAPAHTLERVMVLPRSIFVPPRS